MCTRAMYVGEDSLVLTGRTMDWGEDMFSEIWVFPRGMTRSGGAGPDSVTWTSRYGSLCISVYNAGTADGMNEAGLVMNGLYLTESDYGAPDGRAQMTIMAFGGYVLDCFADVAEAVESLQDDHIQLIAPTLPDGSGATVHMSLSDPTGDSAIFEWIDGRLTVHRSAEYRVMTNSPTFEQQLAIQAYWAHIDPLTFLPGSINAADRFVRASFLIDAIPTSTDPNIIGAVPDAAFENQAALSVLSVMRSMGVPLGIRHPSDPNIASTLWRTVWDHKNKQLFFDSATSPNVFWVPLEDLDFTAGAPVTKLPIAGGAVFAGNAAEYFVPTEPFAFLGAA